MKLKSILSSILALVCIAGCSKTEVESETQLLNGNLEKTTVQLKLNQAVKSPLASRAAVTTTASDAEKAIVSGTIYAFTETGILESATPFVRADMEDAVTLEIECGVGQRRFYAMINHPDDFTPPQTLSPAVTIYDFEKYVYEVSNMASLTTPATGFFMTNLSTPNLETLEKDVVNDVSIAIGRATAKLNVAYLANTKVNGEPNGTLTEVNYKLKSTAKHMYLASIYDELNVFKTPKYGEDYDADNFIISPSSETSTYIGAIDDAANCFYMTENAAPEGFLRRGSLTYVVIKGVYTPKKNYVDGDGATLPAPTSAVTFFRKTEIDGTGDFVKFADEYCYSAIPAVYDDTQYRFEEYEDGVCYYPFVIRGNGTDVGEPASYDIVRNHLYKAQIIVLNGPGWWSEDATDPGEGPELGGETNMEITFDVQDWTSGTPQEGGI